MITISLGEVVIIAILIVSLSMIGAELAIQLHGFLRRRK